MRSDLRLACLSAAALSSSTAFAFTAEAGRAAYEQACVACHGETLRLGGGSTRQVPATITPEIRPQPQGHALYVFALPERG